MRLLILTQKIDINDDLLGFFHKWIDVFADDMEKVTVIALEVGQYRLPSNVKIISLGKESGASKLKYLINFYHQIWRERKNYDAVLVHMNKEYVILGGLFWRLLGKKIGLWYVHKNVSFLLVLAEKLANIIFSSSPESFRLNSKKVKFVGHGIDLNKFSFKSGRLPEADSKLKIIYLGRISQIKNQRLLIEAVSILFKEKKLPGIEIKFIGGPATSKDKIYLNGLRNLVKDHGLEKNIIFLGSVPYREIEQQIKPADLSVNLCPTGGLDKTVLESLACGVPTILLNQAFLKLLDGYEEFFLLKNSAPAELAKKIFDFTNLPNREKIIEELGHRIKKDYDQKKIIKQIGAFLNN